MVLFRHPLFQTLIDVKIQLGKWDEISLLIQEEVQANRQRLDDSLFQTLLNAEKQKIGEKKGDPLSMYLADIFTVPMNLSGIPAISVPANFSTDGLPIGMQFASNNFEENKLFSICKFLSDNKISN